MRKIVGVAAKPKPAEPRRGDLAALLRGTLLSSSPSATFSIAVRHGISRSF